MFALKLQRVYTSAFLFHFSKNWDSKIKTRNFTALAIFKKIDTKENRVRAMVSNEQADTIRKIKGP